MHRVLLLCVVGVLSRVLEREVSTLRDVVKEVIVKTSSSEALEENREFLKSFSVAQVTTRCTICTPCVAISIMSVL